jgi:hypothetical protein
MLTPTPSPLYAQQAASQEVRPLAMPQGAVESAAALHPAASHLMTVFAGAVDATFAAFGVDAVYTLEGATRSRSGSSRGARTRSSALARPASIPRRRPSRCGRARSPTRAPTISSSSMADLRRPGRAGTARSRSAGLEPRYEAGVSEPVSPAPQTQMASPTGIGGDTAMVIQAPTFSPSATFATLHR